MAGTGSHGHSTCQGGWKSRHLTLSLWSIARVSMNQIFGNVLDSVATVEVCHTDLLQETCLSASRRAAG